MTVTGANAEARVPGACAGRRLTPKRLSFAALLAACVLALPLLIAELAYRNHWFDAYRPELLAYNPPDSLGDGATRPTVLALGDSFTAGTATYPERLRALLPEWRIVNAGVSGTGVVQANVLAPSRLKRFAPKVCIYQVYVGNDLFDLRYPANGANVSAARRLYWFAANHVRVLGWLNYRLGQWHAGLMPAYASASMAVDRDEPFLPERYDARERLYLAAEPSLLDNHVFVTAARAREYDQLRLGLARLQEQCRAAGASLILLIIPHAAQVAPVYRERMAQLGATFANPDRLGAIEYPFAQGIRRMVAAAADVHVVDPLAALQAAEREGITVYYTHDGHLNQAGQQCVAELLAAEISEIGGEQYVAN